MGSTVLIRNLDKELWNEFKQRCKRKYGKEWGHLPKPNSPKTSAVRYVLEQLIHDYLEGTHTQHEDDVILEVMDRLEEIQEQQPQTGFSKKQIDKTVAKVCRRHKLRDPRTIRSYQAMFIDGDMVVPADGLPVDDYVTLFKIKERIYPEMELYR